MRTSLYPIITLKEDPADAEVISHKLMLRAGLIRKLAAGVYSWLPLGLRVLRNVEAIIRDEMNSAGAFELLMPAVQPAELWQESTRWEQYGPELLRLKDRHGREFCFGPTHEEVITDLVRREIRSYKQLPLTFYQIQTKFRDEIRPRFGVMRAREFIMKDAYSFHADDASLQKTYQNMHSTYTNIFTRIGLKFRPVEADSGSIGGNRSHEFHVLADSGEDAIVFSDCSDYAANVEQAPVIIKNNKRAMGGQKLTLVDTPNVQTIEEVAGFLNVKPENCVKTLVIIDDDKKLFALILRGDHELNEVKVGKLPGIKTPIRFATPAEIRQAMNADTGSLGPIKCPISVIVDQDAALCADFVCGANIDAKHYTGVNWERDLPLTTVADIRKAITGDPSPDGKGSLKSARGIEVGHIFQLGNKYSEALKAVVLDENGKTATLIMGCYGIGVTRVVAAAIEQNHDNNGIIWPDAIAPFQMALLPLNLHKSERVRETADSLYLQLRKAGIEVLYEDTKTRPGVMFATMELIGIPHRLVISERGLDAGTYEYKGRRDNESVDVKTTELVEFLKQKGVYIT